MHKKLLFLLLVLPVFSMEGLDEAQKWELGQKASVVQKFLETSFKEMREPQFHISWASSDKFNISANSVRFLPFTLRSLSFDKNDKEPNIKLSYETERGFAAPIVKVKQFSELTDKPFNSSMYQIIFNYFIEQKIPTTEQLLKDGFIKENQ